MKKHNRKFCMMMTVVMVVFTGSLTAEASWKKFRKKLKKTVVRVVTAPVSVPVIVARETTRAAAKATGSGELKKRTEELDRVQDKIDRAPEKISQELKNGISNTGEALQALGYALDRQQRGYRKALSDAEKRVREGKFVEAMWYLSVDPYRVSEKNAARAVQESSMLNMVAQAAASTTLGPGGAAAYAAWFTYRQTGDIEMALKVGVITGTTNAAMGATGKMPFDAKKLVLSSAIGGLAVAAAGGDDEAIREGMFKAGAMVVVQAGYRAYTGHGLDPKASETEAYCMMSPAAPCADEDVYVRDRDGNVLDDEGKIYNEEAARKGYGRPPAVDTSRFDPKANHVGNWAHEGEAGWNHETGKFMTGVSKAPGMQAMSIMHDKLAIDFQMSELMSRATIVPAIVVTYVGMSTPTEQHIQKSASHAERRGRRPPEP